MSLRSEDIGGLRRDKRWGLSGSTVMYSHPFDTFWMMRFRNYFYAFENNLYRPHLKKSLSRSFSLNFFLRINTGICSLWNFHDYSALSCSNFYRSQDFDLAIFVFENWRFRSGMIYCLMNVQCPCNWSTPSRFSALHACQSKSLLTTCRAHTHDWQRWGARS